MQARLEVLESHHHLVPPRHHEGEVKHDSVHGDAFVDQDGLDLRLVQELHWLVGRDDGMKTNTKAEVAAELHQENTCIAVDTHHCVPPVSIQKEHNVAHVLICLHSRVKAMIDRRGGEGASKLQTHTAGGPSSANA